jgi:hypothetical protein
MLPRVIEIDDLHSARKVYIRQIRDPFGSVAHQDLLFRAASATVLGSSINLPNSSAVSMAPE